MNTTIGLKLKELLINWGLSEQYASLTKSVIIVLLILILAFLAYFVTNKILFRIVRKLVQKTKYTWDDIILQQKVFKRLSHLIPAIIIYYFAEIGLTDFPETTSLVQSVTYIYMIFAGMLVFDAFLDALHSAYMTLPISQEILLQDWCSRKNLQRRDTAPIRHSRMAARRSLATASGWRAVQRLSNRQPRSHGCRTSRNIDAS